MSGAYSKIFSRKGHQILSIFQAYFSPAELILSNLSNKTTLERSGGMVSRKMFENVHTGMAILVLFEKISYFWPLILSASLNMMHFVCTVSIMRT